MRLPAKFSEGPVAVGISVRRMTAACNPELLPFNTSNDTDQAGGITVNQPGLDRSGAHSCGVCRVYSAGDTVPSVRAAVTLISFSSFREDAPGTAQTGAISR